MSDFIFKTAISHPSEYLPLTLISLEDWSFITVRGADSRKYLQDQLTVDVFTLKKNDYTLCAHCNFNGKVWSVMYLFHYQKNYAYIERTSVVNQQIHELKKYAIFSKVEIRKENDIYLLGLAGLHARNFLLTLFNKIPDRKNPIIVVKEIIIFWFEKPNERFLLALSSKEALILKSHFTKKIFFNCNEQWLLLDIESGIPVIDQKSSAKFLPQEINLEHLKAINFKKGCYYGQEMISRIYFRNLNKRVLCCLKSTGTFVPSIGSQIEMKIAKKWHKIGILLSFVHVYCKDIWIQVVLNNSIEHTNVFRIHGYENIFSII